MAGPTTSPADRSVLAASLLAVDPAGLGGAALLRPVYEVARGWVAKLAVLVGEAAPVRRLPVSATDDRVIGGLDLGATLSLGRRVVMRGVLAEGDGGVVVLPLAERAHGTTLSALAGALDAGEVVVERDGVAARHPARVVVVALDESADRPGELHLAPALGDRLAFHMVLPLTPSREAWPAPAEIMEARGRLAAVQGGKAARTFCALGAMWGIESMRAMLHALRAARAHAALASRAIISDEDIAVAAELVLAPRATRVPPTSEEEEPAPPPPAERAPSTSESDDPADQTSDGMPTELLLAAARAMLPPDVLEAGAQAARRRSTSAGRRGAESTGGERGRQLRSAPGRLGATRKLDPVATLRSAAPWQVVRRRERQSAGAGAVDVRRDDFRVRRYKRQTGTTTLIAVDASGSMAMQRLAEAKGAVELLLAQTYVRRDRVGLIGFRGERATLLLAPTRALARAKRLIAALPGGGGTPLASAMALVHDAALGAARDGQDVIGVFLTDARANIARDGSPGRARAMEDARRAAAALRALGQTMVMIDTSPRGETSAREMAALMGARYVALPAAGAREVARAVRTERSEVASA